MNSLSIRHHRSSIRRPLDRLCNLANILNGLSPLGDVVLRCWVAYAFWIAGLLKVRNWDSTLYLFEYEYAVPFLPAAWAAVLGTAVELCGPALLAAGLCGRGAAALLFVFNLVAVISYPELGPVGVEQHKVWGVMLLACLLHGPGKYSVDAWLKRRFFSAAY